MEPVLNIFDTASRAGIFQTFIRLLEGSPLERRLRGVTAYTLFAPADTAFAFISAETFNELLKPENRDALAFMLSYHVVLGKIMSHELATLSRLRTAQGQELAVNQGEEVRVAGGRLLYADIEARNGVIHAIDRLLLPQKSVAATSA